jgi:hypothetical protein
LVPAPAQSDPRRLGEGEANLGAAAAAERPLRRGDLRPQLDSKRRFTYSDGGLELRGRFTTKGKAHGKFSYAVDTCSVVGATWKAASD